MLGHDGDSCLTLASFPDHHPILYWNMVSISVGFPDFGNQSFELLLFFIKRTLREVFFLSLWVPLYGIFVLLYILGSKASHSVWTRESLDGSRRFFCSH